MIALRGELDLTTARAVVDDAMRAAADDSGPVVFDMHDVTFMDSEGLRELLLARRALEAADRALVLRRPQSCVLLVLEVCGVGDLFVIDR